MRRLIIVLAVLALASAHALARAADPVKLDFAGSVTWFGQVPIMVAVDKGYFKDAGIDVTIQVILSSGDPIMALTAGPAARPALGRLPPANAKAAGRPPPHILTRA